MGEVEDYGVRWTEMLPYSNHPVTLECHEATTGPLWGVYSGLCEAEAVSDSQMTQLNDTASMLPKCAIHTITQRAVIN